MVYLLATFFQHPEFALKLPRQYHVKTVGAQIHRSNQIAAGVACITHKHYSCAPLQTKAELCNQPAVTSSTGLHIDSSSCRRTMQAIFP